MNCSRCNTPNEADARFCKNCAMPFMQFDVPFTPQQNLVPSGMDRNMRYLIMLIGWICLTELIAIIVGKIIIPYVQGPDDNHWETVTFIYKIFGWFYVLSDIILSAVLIFLAKNRAVRIILICYLSIRMLDLIVYYIYPMFEKKTMPFTF